LLGECEVSCPHESLDLYCRQIAHDKSPELGVGSSSLPASYGSNWPEGLAALAGRRVRSIRRTDAIDLEPTPRNTRLTSDGLTTFRSLLGIVCELRGHVAVSFARSLILVRRVLAQLLEPRGRGEPRGSPLSRSLTRRRHDAVSVHVLSHSTKSRAIGLSVRFLARQWIEGESVLTYVAVRNMQSSKMQPSGASHV
jgi:hypothetical protein